MIRFLLSKRAEQTSFVALFVVWGFVISRLSALEVHRAADLVEIFENATGKTLSDDIDVLADLDFSQVTLSLPLGGFPNFSCRIFTGSLRGHGYSVKNLVINNSSGLAGLFCMMANATVEDLVIESSCFFNGSLAGALVIKLVGSLTVKNVTNKANVKSDYDAGVFVGDASEIQQERVVISFESCVNEGNVNGKSRGVGAFVGSIERSPNVILTMIHCENKGVIHGNDNDVGGFVGELCRNRNLSVSILNSINSGPVIGDASFVGGFIGFVEYNPSALIVISNCVSRGSVTGKWYVGGFVGSITSGSTMNFTIQNSSNECRVDGQSFSAGFVGEFSNSAQYQVIQDCSNRGNISATNGVACGLFCIRGSHPTVEVLNSVNNGCVRAKTYAYGIANNITRARNVVSMGDVNGSSGSYTFWNNS